MAIYNNLNRNRQSNRLSSSMDRYFGFRNEEEDEDDELKFSTWKKNAESNIKKNDEVANQLSNNFKVAKNNTSKTENEAKTLSWDEFKREHGIQNAEQYANAQKVKELDKVKKGTNKTDNVKAAEDVIGQLKGEEAELFDMYSHAENYEDPDASINAGSKLADKYGWTEDKFARYDDANKTIAQYQNMRDNGDSFLNTDQIYDYAAAKIGELGRDEQQILREYQNKYTDAGMKARNPLATKADEFANSRVDDRETRQSLKALGWNDEKIDEYLTYAERFANKTATNATNALWVGNEDTGFNVARGIVNSVDSLSPDKVIYGGIGGVLDGGRQADGLGRDMNTLGMYRQNLKEKEREVTSNMIDNPIARTAYNVGMSALESAETVVLGSEIGGAVGEILSLTPFATQAYNSSYKEAKDRGLSNAQAQTEGILAGVIEAGTELLPLENFGNLLKRTRAEGREAVNLFKEWAKQSGMEGIEEVIGDIGNRYVDYLVAGKDGKTQLDIAIQNYMDANPNMTYEEASAQAEKDFWIGVLEDFGVGAASGSLLTGYSVATAARNANKSYKAKSESVTEYNKEVSDLNSGETEYEKATKKRAEDFINNPTKFIQESIDDSTKKGERAKKDLQRYVDKVESGKKLSINDKYNIEEILNDAPIAEKNDSGMFVPDEFRAAETSVTVEEGRKAMIEAKTQEEFAKAYQSMKNSTSVKARQNADMALEEMTGMAQSKGFDIDAAKIDAQEAYMAGLRGETLDNLSESLQIAFNEGKQKRLQSNKRTIDSVAQLQGNVDTSNGVRTLTMAFDKEGKIITNKGAIDVDTLADDSNVKMAYEDASEQNSTLLKNTYLRSIKDGDNLVMYKGVFNGMHRAGATGLSYDKAMQNSAIAAATKIIGEDRAKAFYNLGRSEYEAQISKEGQTIINNALNVKSKGNGTFTDMRTVKENEVDSNLISTIAKYTGLDIVLADTKNNGEQASFNATKSVITIDENTAGQIVHELAEFTNFYNGEGYKALSEAVLETASDILGSKYSKVVNTYQKTYQDFYDNTNAKQNESYLDASREMVNDALVAIMAKKESQEILANKLVEKVGAEQAKTIGEKIKEFFNNIRKAISNLFKNSNMTGYQRDLYETEFAESEKIANQFIDALDKAIENYNNAQIEALNEKLDSVGLIYDTQSESVSPSDYSLKTWTESDYTTNKKEAIKSLAEAMGCTEAKARKYINDINSIARMIADDRVRLDFDADPVGSSFVSNAEYGGSIDFSTICKKRLLYTGTLQSIQKQIGNRVITAEDYLDIRNAMLEDGLQATCGCCYVEGSRAKMGEFMKEFIKRYAKDNPKYVPTMYEVTMPDGIRQLRAQHPEVWEARNYFLNRMGQIEGHTGEKNVFGAQGKPKDYSERTEYRGEILDKFLNKKDQVAQKNLNGGLRLQSFSDFEIVNLLDCMQVITDMARCGLAGQAYTKVFEFADALGNTGLKINLSLMGKGVDADGNLILDEVNGMSKDEAITLRNKYSKNVGTIIVAFNEEQIRAAMKADYIDYIIPFHRSQWKKSQYDKLGLPQFTKDFTMYQNDRVIKENGKLKKADKNHMPNEYWEYDKSGRYNAEKYINMCNEEHKAPKFAFLLEKNSEGKYYLPKGKEYDGYFKLLIDFKMYDNNGVGSPQMPVQPNFSMEECKKMLNDYTGGHETFPVAEKIADKFAKKIIERGKEFDVKYSVKVDTKGKELSEGQRRFFKDSKALDEDGKLMVLYHGTDDGGFTVFNPAMSDDKISLFSTSNRNMAETYTFNGDNRFNAYDMPKEIKTYEDLVERFNHTDYGVDNKDGEIIVYDLESGDELVSGKNASEVYAEYQREYSWTGEEREDFAGVYEMYANLKNPLIIEGSGSEWNNIVPEDYMNDEYIQYGYVRKNHNKADENGRYSFSYMDGDNPTTKHFNRDEFVDMFGERLAKRAFDEGRWIDDVFVRKSDGMVMPKTTREFAEYAKENGYDGVILRDIEDVGSYGERSEYGDVVIAFNSNQYKDIRNLNPTEDDDIRYSRDMYDDFELLFDDWDDVNQYASILEEGAKAGKALDEKKVKGIANKLRKEISSKYDADQLADNLQKAFNYMATNEHVNYADMMRIFKEIATPVIEEVTEKVGEEEYRRFVNSVKGYKIALNDKQMQEVKNTFGSYAEFKKRMSPFTFSSNGASLDSIWNEMVEASGYVLDMDTVTNDMPSVLHDTLQAMKPAPKSVYGANTEDAAKDLAMRIVEEYLMAQNNEKAAEKVRKRKADVEKKLKEEYKEKLANAKQSVIENKARMMANKEIKANTDLNLARIAEIKARYKKEAENKSEREKAKHQKDMIEKKVKTLTNWIMKPTEQHHVPTEMVNPILEFVQALDFVTPDIKKVDWVAGKWEMRVYDHSITDENGKTKPVYTTIEGNSRNEVMLKYYDMLNEGRGSEKVRGWKQRMQNIIDIYKSQSDDLGGIGQLLDSTLAEELEELKKSKTASVNNLTSSELNVINRVLENIQNAVNKQNKMFTQNAEISDIAEDTIKVGNESDKKRIKVRNLNMLNADTYFYGLGEGAEKVYKGIRSGFNTFVKDIMQAKEYMLNVTDGIKKGEIRQWTDTVHHLDLSYGSIDITEAQIMSLYELNKRGQALSHYKGGVQVNNSEKVMSKYKKKNIHLTDADLQKLFSILSSKQIEVADSLQKYLSTECAKQGNETTRKMYGYEKFTEENYFPISVDKDFTASNNSNETVESLNRIERSGFTKNLIENASNPMVVSNIFDVFTNHVSDMASYHGYAAPLKDAMRWYNYKNITPSENEGFMDYTGVKKAIADVYGKGGQSYFTQLIKDINQTERSKYIGNLTSSLISGYKASAVGGNLRVIIQQPTAYFRAMNVINPKYLTEAMLTPRQALKYGKLMREESEIAQWKSEGYFETSIGKSMKEIVTGQSSKTEKLKNALMSPAGVADDLTWGLLYSAVAKEQKALAKGENLTEEELNQRIKDRFDEVVDRTQVVDSTIHRTQYMRGKDTLNKLQTAFMAEPMKSYNMLLRAIMEDQRNGGVPTKTIRAASTFVVTSVATAAAAALIDGLRKTGDDDDFAEVYMNALIDGTIDNVNPLNMIPVLKDVSNTLINSITGNSYSNSSTRMDMDAINSLVDAGKALVDYIGGDSNKTIYGIISTELRPLSQITGIPLYNLQRDVVAIYNQFGEDLLKTVPTVNSKYKPIYESIARDDDMEVIKEKINKAMEEEGTIKDVQSGISSRYKSDYYDMLQTDAEEAKSIAEMAKKGLMATGMSEKEADQTILEWEADNYTYNDMDKAIASGEGIQEAMEHIQELKDADKIIKHIVERYASTFDYNKANNIDSQIDENVAEALKYLGTNYNSAKSAYDKSEAEKAEKAAIKAKKDEAKQKTYDIIDSGSGDYKSAINNWYNTGASTTTIKSSMTDDYVKPKIKEYMSGNKSAESTLRRIATIKAYIDQQAGTKIAKKWKGDYYAYEMNQINKMMEEYKKNPW